MVAALTGINTSEVAVILLPLIAYHPVQLIIDARRLGVGAATAVSGCCRLLTVLRHWRLRGGFMRKLGLFFVTLGLLACFATTSAAVTSGPVEVLKVIDGDSIIVAGQVQMVLVRQLQCQWRCDCCVNARNAQ